MDDVYAENVFAPNVFAPNVFEQGGRLSAVLDGFESRAEQAELAAAVADALASGVHLLAEAGTGTGKSLAYLIPALASGERVVVATATKALQEQLLTKDVPLAARALGREVKVVVLKGRQNYLCRKAVDGFGLLGGGAPRARTRRRGVRADLAVARPDGDRRPGRADLRAAGEPWSELAVGADRCLGRRCAFVGMCFSEAARRRARDADLVIVNTRSTSPTSAYGSSSTRRSSPSAAVIFDEAHRLEDTASDWLGGGVSRYGLARLERDVERARVPKRAFQCRLVSSTGSPRGRGSDRRRRASLGAPTAARGAADQGQDARRPARRARASAGRDERRARPPRASRSGCGRRRPGVPRGGRARSCRLVGARRARGGRPSTSRGGSARRCGRAARRRFSSPRR